MLELNACVVGCELPIGLGVMFVAISLPSGNLVDEGLDVWQASVEAQQQLQTIEHADDFFASVRGQ